MQTSAGEVEKGKLTIVSGGPTTGKTRKMLEAAKELAVDGWTVHYYCCDDHPVTISKRLSDDPKYDKITFAHGNKRPGFISEVIAKWEQEEPENRPDALVIEGYPIGPNELRLLQAAGKNLNIAILPSQQPQSRTLR